MAQALPPPRQDRPVLPLYFWNRKIIELQHQNLRIVQEALAAMFRIVHEHRYCIFGRETDVKAIVEVPGLLPAIGTNFNTHSVLIRNVLSVLYEYLKIYAEDFGDRTLENRVKAERLDLSMLEVAQNELLRFDTRKLAMEILWKFFPSFDVEQLEEDDDWGVDYGVNHPPRLEGVLPDGFWLNMAEDFQDENETVVYEALRTMEALAEQHTRREFDRRGDITHIMLHVELMNAFGTIFDRHSLHVDTALDVLQMYLKIHREQGIPGFRKLLERLRIDRALQRLKIHSQFQFIRKKAHEILDRYFIGPDPLP